MNQNRNEERTVLTPVFRVSFPNMFTAVQINGQGEPKYGMSMIFSPDDDLSALKHAARIAAEDRWGANIPKGIASPFKSGTEINDRRESRGKARFDGYDGNIILNTTSYEMPGLVDQNKKTITFAQKGDFYAGCYARAQVYAHAYDTAGNMGVTFFLNAAQKVKDGEPFSGRANPDQIFDKIPTSTGGSTTRDAGPSGNAGGLFD